jgi:hypothetical protein
MATQISVSVIQSGIRNDLYFVLLMHLGVRKHSKYGDQATYRLDGQVIVVPLPKGAGNSTFPQCPYRTWDLPILLSDNYVVLCPLV